MNGISSKPIVGAAEIIGNPRDPSPVVGLAVPYSPPLEATVGAQVSKPLSPGVGDCVMNPRDPSSGLGAGVS